MIRLHTNNASARVVRGSNGVWLVTQLLRNTFNGYSAAAILAECDTEAEAQRVVDALNDLALHLGEVGEVSK